MEFYSDSMGFIVMQWELIVIHSDFRVTQWDFIMIQWDFRVIQWDL